jgi:hypothetical protein
VQTEGKVAPYPDGSLWMEAPGMRSLLFQQQSASIAAAAAAANDADGDNSSVGFHSVQSLWRGGGGDFGGSARVGGGGGGGSVSLMSSDDNYSAKTASHVLQAPARGAGYKSSSSKTISRMRKQAMKDKKFPARDSSSAAEYALGQQQQHYGGVGNSGSAYESFDNSLMSIEGEMLYGKASHTGGSNSMHSFGGGGGGGVGGSSLAAAGSRALVMPKTPVSVILNSPMPAAAAPSPLMLGSSQQLLAGLAHGGLRPHSLLSANNSYSSNNYNYNHSHSYASSNSPMRYGGGQAGAGMSPSPLMSISGQGFVAPMVLPKLS